MLGLFAFLGHQPVQIILEIVDLKRHMLTQLRLDPLAFGIHDPLLRILDETLNILFPNLQLNQFALRVLHRVRFRQKRVFININRPPIAIILNRSAFLILRVHELLRLQKVMHHFIMNVHLQTFILQTQTYDVKDVHSARGFDDVLEPVEIQNPSGVLRHFYHIGENALQTFRDLLVVRTETDAVRVESHHRVEQPPLLPIVSLHFLVQYAHRLQIHFH